MGPRPMAAVAAVAAVLLAVVAVSTSSPLGDLPASAAEPSTSSIPGFPIEPGFLAVPDPLPAGAPGTIIDQAPFAGGPFSFAVEGHQVLYLSTDRFGQPTAVSGTVLVPVGVPAPPGGRGVVAWAHGTTGLSDCNAPSIDAQLQQRVNSPDSYDRITQILAAGHIVTSSDYPGLGTPGVHPYLDGLGEGRAVLDSIRAARELGGTGPAVVVGFSQGSQAAIFAGAEHPTHAPELDLRGVVPVGTPSRFGEAFAAVDLPVVAGYINNVLAGILAGRPDLDRTEILTPSGEAAYDSYAARSDHAPGPIAEPGACFAPDFDLADDLRADPKDVPDWRDAFEENNPGQRRIDVPVLMVQSESDEQALAFLADGVCRSLQANGTDVRMWRYDDEGHAETVEVSSDDRATWVLDRLAGRLLTDGVPFTGEEPQVLTTCPAEEPPPDGPGPEGPGPDQPAPASPPASPLTTPARFTG